MSYKFENTANRDKLNAICLSVKDKIVNLESNMEPTKPKWFGTFPYPYMNGLLHLGHAYTATKVDFTARFMKSQGYNVLFPFAFHATGIPIYACANKIRHELTGGGPQTRILLDMGVLPEDIHKFVDPEYWVTYFTARGIEDVREIGLISDMRRSFYTTRMNPAYDSFVTWQFEHLLREGYVTKGKRFVIYSIADEQPCADHDRSVGEGVEPAKYFITQVPSSKYNYLITGEMTDKTIYINSHLLFVSFTHSGQTYITSENFYANYSRQCTVSTATPISSTEIVANLQMLGYTLVETTRCNHASGLYASKSDAIEADRVCEITYYEPSSLVMSRSGDKCIVSLTDQWFIDYGKEEIKKIVREHVSMGEFEGDFNRAIEWLNMWPCSRSFGLGTRLPGTDYLIDSLSDSTIYMAYYSIAHLIDLLPSDAINSALWDYVFLGKGTYENTTVKQMRDEFLYWYPLDMRISGKDLVSNHLTMCLFNHAMIWGDKAMLPRCFRANGYLTLNGRKMSKSDGNFMTMRAACEKFSPDVVRFVLACSDGYDDANFDEKVANAAIMRFESELKWIGEHAKTTTSDFSPDIWDHIFEDTISQAAYDAAVAYKAGHFMTVTNIICALTTARQTYVSAKKAVGREVVESLFDKYIRTYVMILEPIAPHLCRYIIDTYISDYEIKWPETQIQSKWKFYYTKITECVDSVNYEISRSRKKGRECRKFELFWTTNYTEIQEIIIKHACLFNPTVKTWNEHMNELKLDTDSITIQQIRQFALFVKDMFQKYHSEYFDWVRGTDLIEIVMLNIPKYVKDSIVFTKVDTSFDVFPGKFVMRAV